MNISIVLSMMYISFPGQSILGSSYCPLPSFSIKRNARSSLQQNTATFIPTLNKPNQNVFHHHQPPCRPYRRYLQHHTIPYCPHRMARECNYQRINHIKCSQHRLSRDGGTLGGYLGGFGGCCPRNRCLDHLVHRLSHHQSQSEGSKRSARPTSSSGDVVGGIEISSGLR